jgi:hypothetical protein
MYWSSADLCGSFRLKAESHKTFEIIIPTKSVFLLNFGSGWFGGHADQQSPPPPFGCDPVMMLLAQDPYFIWQLSLLTSRHFAARVGRSGVTCRDSTQPLPENVRAAHQIRPRFLPVQFTVYQLPAIRRCIAYASDRVIQQDPNKYNAENTLLKIPFFWHMTLCQWVTKSRPFEIMQCPHPQGYICPQRNMFYVSFRMV